jgi:hypothetical protein
MRHVWGREACRVWVGDPEEKRPFQDLGAGGRIILKWIFKKWDGLIWLRIGIGCELF